MQINSSNNHSLNVNFSGLRKLACLESFNDSMIACELERYAEKSDFFKKHDVLAKVQTSYNKASLILDYKPLFFAKGVKFLERLKNVFVPYKRLIFSEKSICLDDASFFLAQKIRKMSKNDDLMLLTQKNIGKGNG